MRQNVSAAHCGPQAADDAKRCIKPSRLLDQPLATHVNPGAAFGPGIGRSKAFFGLSGKGAGKSLNLLADSVLSAARKSAACAKGATGRRGHCRG